jgi:hypothetical protein
VDHVDVNLVFDPPKPCSHQRRRAASNSEAAAHAHGRGRDSLIARFFALLDRRHRNTAFNERPANRRGRPRSFARQDLHAPRCENI